jgi:hypothetical protein
MPSQQAVVEPRIGLRGTVTIQADGEGADAW